MSAIRRINNDLSFALSNISNWPNADLEEGITELKKLQSELNPALLDIQDTKDVKKLLASVAGLLITTFTKLKQKSK